MNWKQVVILSLPVVVLLAGVYGQVYIAEYPQYVLPTEEEIHVKVVAKVGDATNVSQATLRLYVKDVNGKIVYIDERTYEDGLAYPLIEEFVIPVSELGEGDFKVCATFYGVYKNGTVISTSTDCKNIRVSYYETPTIKIVEIYPDFTKIKRVKQQEYTVTIGIKNYGFESAKVKVILRVIDEEGFVQIEKVKTISLSEKEKEYVTFKVPFGLLTYGNYKLVIQVYKDEALMDERTYNIKVGYKPALEIKEAEFVPPKYKPGDLIMLKVKVKNVWDTPVVVKPELISEDLNIYRELDTITIEPNEIKEIKVVFYLPELKPGEYKVKLKLTYGDQVQTVEKKIVIPGEKKILEVEVKGLKVINVSKEGTFKVIIRTFVEDLIPVRIEAKAGKSEVLISKKELYVGGKGLTREVTLIVSPLTVGKDTLTVRVIDERTGKVLDEKTIEYEIIGVTKKEEVEKVPAALSIERVILLAVAIAIVTIAVTLVLFGRKRKKEEEKPSA